MNLSNIIITAVITVLFTLNNKEITNLSLLDYNTSSLVAKGNIQGGPRTVIQAMTEVVVYQPTATNLYITIVDSEGTVVIDQTTQSLETRISTVGLKKDTYTIKTVDDYGNVQIFTISI